MNANNENIDCFLVDIQRPRTEDPKRKYFPEKKEQKNDLFTYAEIRSNLLLG